jgi:ribosomal protein S18 acetylase RimI-like enzyme
MSEWVFRDHVVEDDRRSVRDIVGSTGFFSAEEVDVAEELVRERLQKGADSGYLFVFAQYTDGQVHGYACFGPVPCPINCSAPRRDGRGRGLGKALMAEGERQLGATGGGKLIAETSSREQYAPTQAFYRSCGFREEARIRDYYAPGEDILYFTKPLG